MSTLALLPTPIGTNMIEQFKDGQEIIAHAEFQSWRRQNPDGFFLNIRTKTEAMLHRVHCQHPGDTEWECGEDGFHSLTRRTKICSESINELQVWAMKNAIKTIKKCPDCAPYPVSLPS
jgi:hypothetical protein